MKLPLDIFQILGLSPGSSARNVLMMLERRLESCNYSGFTQKTLGKRNELLREYSRSLLDTEKRNELESLYQTIDSKDDEKRYIAPPHGSEVAGLLLLLESGGCDDCFNIASDLLLHRLQETSTDSTLHADLYLLIGYATLEYAGLLRSQRHYEFSVRILEKGLELINNKITQDNMEQTIRCELEDIIPFRILDLLSRNMDEPIRDLGINLLSDFVMKRGGLDSESSLCMKDDEFKAFFRQIRYYMTVQEQINLYQTWGKNGSDSASFLLGISLVASGFARRKPERLVQAQEIMQKLDANELKEITAYISLLLGNVNIQDHMPSLLTEDRETNRDLASEVALGKLCASCREWLARDVLEGYRDLEADPDLEAYFSDRDVTTFIEKCDRELTLQYNSNRNLLDPLDLSNRLLQRSGGPKRFKSVDSFSTEQIKSGPNTKVSDGKELLKIFGNKWIISALSLLLILAAWTVFANRNIIERRDYWKKEIKNHESKEPTKPKTGQSNLEKPLHNKSTNSISSYPSESEVNAILSEWLMIKSQVLSGLSLSDRITKVATVEAIKRLESERKEDIGKREKQLISSQLIDLEIVRREPNQIEIIATIKYSDKRIGENNRVIEKTPKHVFNKIYILVNKGGGWLVQ